MPQGNGLVVGQIVDAVTNRPIANAIVALSSGPALGREMVETGLGRPNPGGRIITDDQGRFVFHNLGAGIYTFNTSAAGYLDGAYGQRRPSGPAQPFVLAEDQRIGNVTIRLWREASMGGTVTDDAGEPVVGQSVSLQRRNTANGRTQLMPAASARTDDRGVYRFAKLLPGDYRIVIASAINSVPLPVGDALIHISNALPPFLDANGRVRAYPTTYYPNATSAARASIVTVEAGDERNGLDIQLQSIPLVGIAGTLTGPNVPEAHFGVRLASAEEAVSGTSAQQDAAVTATDGSGGMTMSTVDYGPAGRGGPPPLPTDPALWAEMPISVGDDPVTGVHLQLQVAPTVSGRMVFEGAAVQPAADKLQAMTVSLAPAAGGKGGRGRLHVSRHEGRVALRRGDLAAAGARRRGVEGISPTCRSPRLHRRRRDALRPDPR